MESLKRLHKEQLNDLDDIQLKYPDVTSDKLCSYLECCLKSKEIVDQATKL